MGTRIGPPSFSDNACMDKQQLRQFRAALAETDTALTPDIHKYVPGLGITAGRVEEEPSARCWKTS